MKRLLATIFAVAAIGILSAFANEEDPRLGLVAPVAVNATSTTTTNPAGPPSGTASGSTVSPSTTSQPQASGFKDGTFTGQAVDNPYGTVQISAVISNGKITDINFLKMPSDMGHSAMLSRQSAPLLKQTTLNAQSANIDFVSGATFTSESYQQSLQSALDQAKV